jgi:hypothetical protein
MPNQPRSNRVAWAAPLHPVVVASRSCEPGTGATPKTQDRAGVPSRWRIDGEFKSEAMRKAMPLSDHTGRRLGFESWTLTEASCPAVSLLLLRSLGKGPLSARRGLRSEASRA